MYPPDRHVSSTDTHFASVLVGRHSSEGLLERAQLPKHHAVRVHVHLREGARNESPDQTKKMKKKKTRKVEIKRRFRKKSTGHMRIT